MGEMAIFRQECAEGFSGRSFRNVLLFRSPKHTGLEYESAIAQKLIHDRPYPDCECNGDVSTIGNRQMSDVGGQNVVVIVLASGTHSPEAAFFLVGSNAVVPIPE